MIKYITTVLVALLIGAGVGYYMHKPATETQIAYKDKTVIQTVTKTVKGDVITKTETRDVVKTEVKAIAALMPKYSISATGDLNGLHDIQTGYRLIGNLWLTSGFDLTNRHKPAAIMGIRIDF